MSDVRSDAAGMVETATPAVAGLVVDVAAVTVGGAPMWLLLSEGGRIVRWEPGSGDVEQVAAASLPVEEDRDRWADRIPRPRLHASADGRFAAVVNDYGRFGQVLDLATGEVTMALDNTGNEEETVPFSLAFLEHAGRTVVVHRTDWNRLDVSVAASGALLTARPSPRYEAPGGPAPEHHLDYFHGAVYASPDGRRILDDGWVWHPLGVPTVYSVERWLTLDVWESEDAALHLCARDYYWDHAMTWIDGTRIAVEGIGNDDSRMLAGARVFDVGHRGPAVEVATIAGPAGRFFSDGVVLFSADPDGLHSWDPAGGERLGTVAGFTPTHHHRAAGIFLELRDGAVLTWPQA